MISIVLKDLPEIYRIPPSLPPSPPRVDNLWRPMTVPGTPFVLYVTNTLVVAGVSLLGTLASNTAVALAFSRMRWWGRNVWFAIMLSTICLTCQRLFIQGIVISGVKG